eukprot:UN23663
MIGLICGVLGPCTDFVIQENSYREVFLRRVVRALPIFLLSGVYLFMYTNVYVSCGFGDCGILLGATIGFIILPFVLIFIVVVSELNHCGDGCMYICGGFMLFIEFMLLIISAAMEIAGGCHDQS